MDINRILEKLKKYEKILPEVKKIKYTCEQTCGFEEETHEVKFKDNSMIVFKKLADQQITFTYEKN